MGEISTAVGKGGMNPSTPKSGGKLAELRRRLLDSDLAVAENGCLLVVPVSLLA